MRERNYNINEENCIEWLKDDDTATVILTQRRCITNIRKLATLYPDEVSIVSESNDGSIVAHVPIDYVSIRKPKKMNLSDEQRKELGERLISNISGIPTVLE
ncbi:MAG: hypothetical protein MJZ37_08160 [Bacilli bacterium]|nr:hypothetical protein [Bacilli bacterium]